MTFALGKLVATRGAVNAMEERAIDPLSLLVRHANGDWGDLCAEDKALNDRAIKFNERILSRYNVRGISLYVITEADRSVTTVLLTDEY